LVRRDEVAHLPEPPEECLEGRDAILQLAHAVQVGNDVPAQVQALEALPGKFLSPRVEQPLLNVAPSRRVTLHVARVGDELVDQLLVKSKAVGDDVFACLEALGVLLESFKGFDSSAFRGAAGRDLPPLPAHALADDERATSGLVLPDPATNPGVDPSHAQWHCNKAG